jgi:Protein of unknown function (DUF1670)
MNNIGELERYQAKTAEQRFLQIMEQDYRYPPRIAQSILEEAKACLLGQSEGVRVGQMRILLLRRGAAHGQALQKAPQIEVSWTVDAGAEDIAVLERYGQHGLRRVRIQRLLDEALERGALATQEDLARALQTSVRTIKRDFAELHAHGLYLPSRGYLKGIGRGQTHKAQIIRRWLQGETYDQLSVHTHHAVSSIQRYIQGFVQVVRLHQEGMSDEQIGLLLQMGVPLVQDYLSVYRTNDQPACRERLAEQLSRLGGNSSTEKGAE